MTLIARAATEAENDQRNRLTAPVWGNRLTLEQYLERERRLAATAFSREGLRSWVLEQDGQIVASHESYRMQTPAGHAEGIASVFVEERLRGNGYAATLLARSLERFREEGAQASILYSEVGTSIYQRIGYQPRPMKARQWPALMQEVPGAADHFPATDGPDPAGSSSAGFRIVLTRHQIDWHRARSEFYHPILAPARPPPHVRAGARSGEAWILWTPDYRLDRLVVLAVRLGTAAENESLVSALRAAAGFLGLPIAEHWASPAIDLPGGWLALRDDEIPMIAPLKEGLRPEDWVDYGRGCWI